MATDRSLLKKTHVGHFLGHQPADPIGAVANMHSQTFCARFHSAEAAASTNVSETAVATLYRAADLKKASWNGDLNVASNGTDYVLFKVYARESGGSQRLIASGNSANAAVTRWTCYDLATNTTSSAFSVAANFASPAAITYEVIKAGSGKFVNTGTLALDFEYTGP